MFNITLFPVYNRVKNVYEMCTTRWDICVSLLTGTAQKLRLYRKRRVKQSHCPHFLLKFTSSLFTSLQTGLPLVNSTLYTSSTPPTITKTNEK